MQGETKQAFVNTNGELITHLSGPSSNISGGWGTPANVRFCLISSVVAQYCGEEGGEPLVARFSSTVGVVLACLEM